jgi:amidase/aspartyl-tRNA(Asn)/glutamyl-tRNA(Gln) amidotransferase subunit A
MQPISKTKLIGLATQFGIELSETEAADVCDRVNTVVAELSAIEEIPTGTTAENVGDRSWHDPSNDPYNAISTVCHVPPTQNHDGRLSDLTVGVKDIIALAGIPMECGSEVMRGFIPGFDATVVTRLRNAGATITLKTNLDEFAGAPHGVTGTSGPITNPYDEERIAGGSSSGSSVAVALGDVDMALGTDTGGSIRIPAAFCGTVGLKPTYGLIPLHGVVENTYTLDHVGPFTRTVEETARALEVMAGKDTADPASLQAAGRETYRVGGYVDAVENPPACSDIEIGVLTDGFGDGVSDAITEQTYTLTDQLEDAGATVRPVSVDYFSHGKAIKNCLSFAEMATHWRAGGAPYRRGGGVDEDLQISLARFGEAASNELNEFYKSKLLAGATLIDGTDGRWYTRAQAAREVLRAEFETALDDVDALVLPTMPDVAPRVEEAFDVDMDYARNVRAANVTRLPAITVPNGTVDGLPVGIQLMGDAFGEAELLGIARTVEEHAKTPAP